MLQAPIGRESTDNYEKSWSDVEYFKMETAIERWTLVVEYDHWFLCESDYPYAFVDEHLILWCKHKNITADAILEKDLITGNLKEDWFNVRENEAKNQSLPKHEHTHFLRIPRFKNTKELIKWIKKKD
jgi:hypothetical protein